MIALFRRKQKKLKEKMFPLENVMPPWRNGLACWTSNSKVSIYLSQATRLSVDFITYFTVIQTKTYYFSRINMVQIHFR